MILRGRANQLPIATGTIACCVTSPPYFGRRIYGNHPDEHGTEDLHIYINNLVITFAEVRRTLRDNGTLWINIGDTAAGSGGAGGDYNPGGTKNGRPKYRQGRATIATTTAADHNLFGDVTLEKLRPGQWCDVPGRLAQALQADGWLLRSIITWDKGQRRPEDLGHVRRPGESSERILMLTKSMRYQFDHTNLDETGDVWHFRPGKRTGPAHQAPFPEELPRRCILPSTEPGDIVLDPYVGSGTTINVAQAHGRGGVGIDLYAGCGQ